jgi:hypothetical protein
MSLVHVFGDESVDHQPTENQFYILDKSDNPFPSKKGEWVAIHVDARTRTFYLNVTTAVDSV